MTCLVPVRVNAVAGLPAKRASPKSAILMRPAVSTKMFSGLMSRCTIPASCANCSASQSGGTIASAWVGLRDPECINCRKSVPSTYSMTR